MSKIHSFVQSAKIGKIGEEDVLNYLNTNDNIESIEDVRYVREYQKKDIDFIVNFKDGKQNKIEIKTDTYKSGNIYYETVSSLETDSIGCFEKTEADYLFYYYIALKDLYIFEMDQYRDWFQTQQASFKQLGYEKRPRNKGRGDSTYTSIGYAYPVKILEELNPKWMRKIHISDLSNEEIY